MRKLTLLALGFLLGACNNGSGSDKTNFAPLVTNLIQDQTTETGAPVEVNGQNFVFSTDPTAFDDVLPADNGPVVQ